MNKQTISINNPYVRPDVYGALAVPVYNNVAFEFEDAAEMADAFCNRIKAPDYARVENPTVPNDSLRRRFYTWLEANELNDPPLFSPIATIAAYTQGEDYRQQMLRYIEDNIRFVENYCREYLPKIKPWRPQASFLVWLDCRDLGLSHDALVDLFVNRAHLALNDGAVFGIGGSGFMRLNVGAPRSVLRQALNQLSNC